jgi:hypothetical protein
MFDGLVCFAIGLPKLGGGFEFGGRWGVEQAVGERAADAFMKENKQPSVEIAYPLQGAVPQILPNFKLWNQ